MIRTGAFVGVTLFALFASANAPPDQYVSFSPGTPTIFDKQTGLTWQRFVTQAQTTQSNIACTNGMRLPTYRELLTLVDEDPHDEWDPDAAQATPRFIDPNAFPGTPGGAFWSMSPNATTGTTKGVDFSTGLTLDFVAGRERLCPLRHALRIKGTSSRGTPRSRCCTRC